ncbi:hypothetical protein B0H17DRAFT_1137867 [Mycena rosella]|uniref:Uncharacterized protein n=1 Tax=Mycena rosella TaxID=1033263 RepID=A0AAD7D811_MYCRO|nr:hypothetical protein B0H17DRAFT_1137867 [Mycena rosella]
MTDLHIHISNVRVSGTNEVWILHALLEVVAGMAILAMIAIGLVWGMQGTAHTRQARGRRGTRGEGLPAHRMLGYIRRMVHGAGQWLVKITGPQANLACQRDNCPRPTGGRRPAQHHHNFHRKTHRPNNPGETHNDDNDSMPGLEPIPEPLSHIVFVDDTFLHNPYTGSMHPIFDSRAPYHAMRTCPGIIAMPKEDEETNKDS